MSYKPPILSLPERRFRMRSPAYPEFALEEYGQRNLLTQDILKKEGIDALFLTMYENVEWLSGFGSESWKLYDKEWWLVLPAQGEPALTVDAIHEGNVEGSCVYEDVRLWGVEGKTVIDRLVDIFKERDLEDKCVAMEYGPGTRLFMPACHWDEIKRRLPHIKWVDGSDIIGEMRALKSPEEIRRIKRANQITCRGIQTAFDRFHYGMTERDLVNLMTGIMLEGGADATVPGVGGYLALSASRINQITPRIVGWREIGKGDLVHVDGGCTFRGYYSDVYTVGIVSSEPHPLIQKCADTVAEALDTVITAVKPGVLSCELVEIADRVIEKSRMTNHIRTMTDGVSSPSSAHSRLGHIGHGIGFGIHEYPFITSSSKMPWRENMVASFEIMLGDPEIGWVEFEENVVVTKVGCERITPMPKKIWALKG
jgi:Xaa-Pro dipeptidase